jgi:hypothetical protein
MKNFRVILVVSTLACSFVAMAGTEDRRAIERDLELFGPAAAKLQAAGFEPRGTVTVLAHDDVRGTDRLRVEVAGLPGNACFTVFLTESADFPFGSMQLVAELCTNQAGRGSVIANLVVLDAFALKTEANPSPPPAFATPINVDLDQVVIWFADSAGDDRFTSAGAGPFDADRDSGVAVLKTSVALP